MTADFKHTRSLRILTILVALLIAACSAEADSSASSVAEGSEGNAGGELEIVTLRHSWIPDDLMLPYVVAKDRGFYAEEGINLVDQPGNGGATAATLVANGDVMFGTGEASHVLNGRNQGLPIISVMQQFQLQPTALLFFKDSGIETWEDLADKTIGGSPTSSSYRAIQTVFAMKGIDRSQGEWVATSAAAQFTALQEGDIDAAQSFLGNLARLEFRDELDALTVADAGFEGPSTALFVTEDFLAQNADLVERFVRATIRGMEAAKADPDAAAEALASQYANIDPPQIAEAWRINEQFMFTDVTETNGSGWHAAESWQQLADALSDADEIDPVEDITSAFTNDAVQAAGGS